MKRLISFLMLALLLTGCQNNPGADNKDLKTFCNPLDLSYRFQLDEPSRREAADPTVVWFRDRYYLFASKSGGYWHSKDLAEWDFIETSEIPTEEYAPTAVGIRDTLYFLASSAEQSDIYKSADPLSGHWTLAREALDVPVWDPAFLLDDDKRLYLFWGCSNERPIYGVELDYTHDFSFIGEPVELIHANPAQYGWEVPGDYNTLTGQAPWIEGAWMNKHKGKYYLQYAGPGTEYKSYSDGVYISESPLGPYQIQSHNPFACKPEGFAAGAGHGSTFKDRYGNYWHIGTVTISQKHIFERRLALYPTFFDEEGTLYTVTKYGDYPMVIPQKKISGYQDVFSGWMLLSYHAETEVSSFIDTLPPEHMTDEDIRTYWAAESGNNGEFAILDLGDVCDVYALQINFAEHDTKLFDRQKGIAHKYTIGYSDDSENWKMLIDQSHNETDHTHNYFPLPDTVSCRYLRISNIEVPGGNFAISGFRVFGKGSGDIPDIPAGFEAKRDANDKRKVHLDWEPATSATGYMISYGIKEDRLYHDYQVYGDTALTINSLDAGRSYYFTVESFNRTGISEKSSVIKIE